IARAAAAIVAVAPTLDARSQVSPSCLFEAMLSPVSGWPRTDHPAHDPRVRAELPPAGEPGLLEQLHGGGEQESRRRVPAGGHLGDGLDEPAAGQRDQVERPGQRRAGDAVAPVLLVDEEAGDPPVRPRRRVLVVGTPVLDAGQLAGTAVLAPPLHDAVLVEHERGVRAAGPDAVLLDRAAHRAPLRPFRVEPEAPAAAEDAVVALDEVRERRPRRGVEGPDGV